MAKMSIGKPKTEDASRKSPPNYMSRRVQTRLLFLVVSFMLVIVLVGWAMNPANWESLFGNPNAALVGDAPLTEQETTDEEIDTSLPRTAKKTETVLGTITAPQLKLTLEPVTNDEGGINKATNNAWEKFLQQVSVEDRRLLRKLLYSYRHDERLTPEEQDKWREVVEQLATRWDRYLERAERDVQLDADLAPEDKGRWIFVLDKLKKAWAEQEQPALLAAVDPPSMTAEQRNNLEILQQRFDQLALEAVRDDTVHRPAEIDAWFRLMEILQQTPAEQLTAGAKGRVGFQQLYKQSDTYRGQLVTVRGNVRLAYHVFAPPNIAGVKDYYVFWLMPLGGPDSPIVVYSLECPPDFPLVPGGTKTENLEMAEPVELTGYYFKRWAYSASDDIRVAPLLLAKTVTWTPAPPAEVIALPNVWLAVVVVLGVGLLAVGLSVLVYAKSQAVPAAEKYSPTARVREKQFDDLQSATLVDPADSLRKLLDDKEERPPK